MFVLIRNNVTWSSINVLSVQNVPTQNVYKEFVDRIFQYTKMIFTDYFSVK